MAVERKPLQKRTVQLLKNSWESLPEFVFPEMEWQSVLEGTPIIPSLPPLEPSATDVDVKSQLPLPDALSEIFCGPTDSDWGALALFVALVMYVQHAHAHAMLALLGAGMNGDASAALVGELESDWNFFASAFALDTADTASSMAFGLSPVVAKPEALIMALMRSLVPGAAVETGMNALLSNSFFARVVARGRVLFASAPLASADDAIFEQIETWLSNPAPGALPPSLPASIDAQAAGLVHLLTAAIASLKGQSLTDPRLVIPL
eukprot:Amastigsp_a339428_103.p3 type:complete len:264 gc:universal Amastigsp_a339428_103:828-37(-)